MARSATAEAELVIDTTTETSSPGELACDPTEPLLACVQRHYLQEVERLITYPNQVPDSQMVGQYSVLGPTSPTRLWSVPNYTCEVIGLSDGLFCVRGRDHGQEVLPVTFPDVPQLAAAETLIARGIRDDFELVRPYLSMRSIEVNARVVCVEYWMRRIHISSDSVAVLPDDVRLSIMWGAMTHAWGLSCAMGAEEYTIWEPPRIRGAYSFGHLELWDIFEHDASLYVLVKESSCQGECGAFVLYQMVAGKLVEVGSLAPWAY